MIAVGLLLSLPTDSIAVRVALASVVAVVAARLLLRARLQSPGVRAAVALLPALAIAAVAIGFARAPALPAVWHTVDATGGLSIPVRDTYLSFAPAALPLLVGAWAGVVLVLLTIRARRLRRTTASLRALAAVGDTPPEAVSTIVAKLAGALRTTPPEVLLVPGLHGGAAVVGLARPMLLVDADLVRRLDRAELEGVLAHELVHVARRDNLVAAALGVLRDAFFFVPAARWSLRRLLREREHVADSTAVEITGRPGALASGLLKVLESARGPAVASCAPLLAEGTLVARVEALCDDRPAPTRLRRHAEVGITAMALSGAVAVAAVVPGAVAGADRQRDGLGLLFSELGADSTGEVEPVRSTVFSAFDEAGQTAAATASGTPGETAGAAVLPLDDPEAVTPRSLAACEHGECASDRHARMRLVPEPVVRVDADMVDRWRLDPVVRSDDGQLGLFWLQRQQVR